MKTKYNNTDELIADHPMLHLLGDGAIKYAYAMFAEDVSWDKLAPIFAAEEKGDINEREAEEEINKTLPIDEFFGESYTERMELISLISDDHKSLHGFRWVPNNHTEMSLGELRKVAGKLYSQLKAEIEAEDEERARVEIEEAKREQEAKAKAHSFEQSFGSVGNAFAAL